MADGGLNVHQASPSQPPATEHGAVAVAGIEPGPNDTARASASRPIAIARRTRTVEKAVPDPKPR